TILSHRACSASNDGCSSFDINVRPAETDDLALPHGGVDGKSYDRTEQRIGISIAGRQQSILLRLASHFATGVKIAWLSRCQCKNAVALSVGPCWTLDHLSGVFRQVDTPFSACVLNYGLN